MILTGRSPALAVTRSIAFALIAFSWSAAPARAQGLVVTAEDVDALEPGESIEVAVAGGFTLDYQLGVIDLTRTNMLLPGGEFSILFDLALRPDGWDVLRNAGAVTITDDIESFTSLSDEELELLFTFGTFHKISGGGGGADSIECTYRRTYLGNGIYVWICDCNPYEPPD